MNRKSVRNGCFLFFGILILGGCEQARTDELMRELCAEDGGVKVFETVILPVELFEKDGLPTFYKAWDTADGGYRFISSDEQLKTKKPTLTKYKFSVVREADGKILGTSVTYIRIGGDLLWRPGPDSSTRCPDKSSQNAFLKQIFLPKN